MKRTIAPSRALHDLGKCQTCLKVLGKTGSWSDGDQEEIELHVLNGYRLLRGRFDYSAEIMLWHHRFQENGYPDELPQFLHEYRQTTQLLIREYGRIVAIADVYDALHRVNEKVGEARALSRWGCGRICLNTIPTEKSLFLLSTHQVFSLELTIDESLT